jgi:hypothetical protein
MAYGQKKIVGNLQALVKRSLFLQKNGPNYRGERQQIQSEMKVWIKAAKAVK